MEILRRGSFSRGLPSEYKFENALKPTLSSIYIPELCFANKGPKWAKFLLFFMWRCEFGEDEASGAIGEGFGAALFSHLQRQSFDLEAGWMPRWRRRGGACRVRRVEEAGNRGGGGQVEAV